MSCYNEHNENLVLERGGVLVVACLLQRYCKIAELNLTSTSSATKKITKKRPEMAKKEIAIHKTSTKFGV